MPDLKPLNFPKSLLLFGIPSVFFILIAYGVIPFLNTGLGLHPALSWFIGGLIVFVPLFILAVALAHSDGYKTKKDLFERLRLKKLSGRDWKYVVVSSLIIFTATGAIMGVSKLLNLKFGIPEIETTPAFMKFETLTGNQRYLLLIWIVMFFFNMYGEELLWRGYILPRQELRFKENAWILNAVLWMLFHLSFGIQLMIMLVPIMIVLPYAVQKTQNTNVGLLIHALLNGPMFILVSLGVVV